MGGPRKRCNFAWSSLLGAAAGWALATVGILTSARSAAAAPSMHEVVVGPAVARVVLEDRKQKSRKDVAFADLKSLPLEPGDYALHVAVPATNEPSDDQRVRGVEIAPCAGRGRILLDGAVVPLAEGVRVVRFPSQQAHEVVVEVRVSAYEKRVACGYAPRIGTVESAPWGLQDISFPSPDEKRGGGKAVLFVPAGLDLSAGAPLLVGLHPWNGRPNTYAAYEELLEAAVANKVVVLLPSGLGNSLYIASAEEEAVRAIDRTKAILKIDDDRVHVFGASMGGAGATTLGFHRPDRFASITSYFGDSKYDLTTYVKSILPDDAAAKKVNALDVVENARNVPVFLVHGDADKSSPVRQSEMLQVALAKLGFTVSFAREAGRGHEGSLVTKHIASVVQRAAATRRVAKPSRVSYRSVRASDVGAYWLHFVKARGDGEAFVDADRSEPGKLKILAASGVTRIELDALGDERAPELSFAPGVARVDVQVRK